MAGSESTVSEARNVLETLSSTLELARQQLLDDTENHENADFDNEIFWTNFIAASKLVSHEATKFCMLFNDPVWPEIEVCKSISEKIERSCLSLLAVFVTLPRSRGKHFYRGMVNYVIDMIGTMKSLCDAIKDQSSTRLQIIGEIWEHCETVEQLPRDNLDAVLIIFKDQYEMLDDASQELMDSLEDDGGNPVFELSLISPPNGIQIPPQRWSDSDRNVLLPCSGLVKASKACIKKTMQAITARGDGVGADCINELDNIAAIAKRSSSLADDFVLSVYPPMNHSAARDHARLLRNNSKELLYAVKLSHFSNASDETWIEFLERAVDHNWIKISDLALAE